MSISAPPEPRALIDRSNPRRAGAIAAFVTSTCWAAIACCPAMAQPTKPSKPVDLLTTSEGRRLIGPVRKSARTLILRGPLADHHLTPAACLKRSQAPRREPLPVYGFDRAELKAPKKGKLGTILHDLVWGNWSANGTVSSTLRDETFGKLSVRWVVERVDPITARIHCVEYDRALDWPMKTMLPVISGMLSRQMDASTTDGCAKAARFLRIGGLLDEAQRWVGRLEALDANDPRVQREQLALEAARLSASLDAIQRLAASGRLRQAAPLLKGLSATFILRSEMPALAQRLARLQTDLGARRATLRRAEAWMAARDAGRQPLTEAQARAIVRLLGPPGGTREAAIERIEGRTLALLREPWAGALDPEALAGTKGAGTKGALGGAELLRAAAALAASVQKWAERPEHAGSFEHPPDQPGGERRRPPLDALAERFSSSALPRPLKLALLASRRYEVPKERGWRKVSFVDPGDPRGKRMFHYYIRIPASYDPARPTPAMLSLHGRISTAKVRDVFWGSFAERWGFVLISPEYVYGRKYGYLTSTAEHRAVIGAWRHAATTLNLDPDRFYLEGSSQGGFASWDIGGARAGELAGVIPSIGSPPAGEGVLVGLANTRVYGFGGSEDGANPVRMKRTIQKLAARQGAARYVEYRGRGHEAFIEEYHYICRWMAFHKRARAPEKIAYVGYRSLDRQCRWLAVDAPLPARLMYGRLVEATGEFDRQKNEAKLATRRARKVILLVDPTLVDIDRELTVRVNGKIAFQGHVRINWRFALASSKARRDGRDIYVTALSFAGR